MEEIYATGRRTKADLSLRDVPVVRLTVVDDKTKGYSLGTTDYLTKPVNREPLHAAVARYRVRGEESAVLLMEDDRATREMIARTLEKSAWSVAEAGHGREALDQLARRR